jgi:(p)ppGpp synthase/HD superfamily hydrolase
MKNEDMEKLKLTEFTPWIQKATRLKSIKRKILGGVSNAFRHQMGVFAILLDHEVYDSVTLKASIIHDLIEDFRDTDLNELRYIDNEGYEVVNVVLELTVRDYPVIEDKKNYLKRILESGSDRAKIVKAADRIDNLMQMNFNNDNKAYIKKYLDETEQYVVAGVEPLKLSLAIELKDLVAKLRKEHGV